MKPLLLDLFCCEGGAATGYHRAGFDVIGVDIEPQPNYPFPFVQANALNPPFRLSDFDAIHASPPCQAWSTATGANRDKWPKLIAPVREMLAPLGVPYVIENVEGARRELRHPIKLCGSAFGLAIRRHRYFESNIALWSSHCHHRHQGRPIGVYGDHPQNDAEYRRPDGTRRGSKANTVEHAREVMGMEWASWRGCCEAIPPAYTEFIGAQLLAHIEAEAAA